MICQEGLTQKGFFFSPGCTSFPNPSFPRPSPHVIPEALLDPSCVACPGRAAPCCRLLRRAATARGGAASPGGTAGPPAEMRGQGGDTKRPFDNHLEGSSIERYSEVV